MWWYAWYDMRNNITMMKISTYKYSDNELSWTCIVLIYDISSIWDIFTYKSFHNAPFCLAIFQSQYKLWAGGARSEHYESTEEFCWPSRSSPTASGDDVIPVSKSFILQIHVIWHYIKNIVHILHIIVS